MTGSAENLERQRGREELAKVLKQERARWAFTLQQVEELTDGTANAKYVEALESGKVNLPAPHVLFALAGLYNYSYVRLMEIAELVRNKRLSSATTIRPLSVVDQNLA